MGTAQQMSNFESHTYEGAETTLEVDDWKVMYGPVGWAGSQKRYFIHHTCTELQDNGEPKWNTWFQFPLPKFDKWCDDCESEPSEGLQAIWKFLGYYR
jgi:hypothetical protein